MMDLYERILIDMAKRMTNDELRRETLALTNEHGRACDQQDHAYADRLNLVANIFEQELDTRLYGAGA